MVSKYKCAICLENLDKEYTGNRFFCFGVASELLMSWKLTDVTNVKRYGDNGHACLIPAFSIWKSDAPSLLPTLNRGLV